MALTSEEYRAKLVEEYRTIPKEMEMQHKVISDTYHEAERAMIEGPDGYIYWIDGRTKHTPFSMCGFNDATGALTQFMKHYPDVIFDPRKFLEAAAHFIGNPKVARLKHKNCLSDFQLLRTNAVREMKFLERKAATRRLAILYIIALLDDGVDPLIATLTHRGEQH